jgi:hypothetical protein
VLGYLLILAAEHVSLSTPILMASTTLELAASGESAMQLCARVAETSPLIQCITNYVREVMANEVFLEAVPATQLALEGLT